MSAAHRVRRCVRLKAVVQMAQWLLRLTTSAVVASRNTGVHVNILAASLHGPRLRQPSAPSVCTPKRLIIGARRFWQPLPVRQINRVICQHISLIQYCRRVIPSGGLKQAQ